MTAATTVFLAVVAAAVSGAAAGGGTRPHPTAMRCLSECAGLRAAAVGGEILVEGTRLGRVSEVRYRGPGGPIGVAPRKAEPRRLVAEVPAGAETGRVRLATAAGEQAATRERLRIADPSQVPAGYRLRSASVRPNRAFFDQAAPIGVSYRFEAPERTGIKIEVVRAQNGRVIRTFRRRALPYTQHRQGWNGLEADGDVADDGAYRFRIGGGGEETEAVGSLRLHGYKFPIRGPHSYGGYLQEFGAPRSGGRRHLGQDVYASCGTRLEAARGGRIQRKDYDSELLGNYVLIDIRGSSADHLYSHMTSPSPFGEGDRVRTGQRVGWVGKTGNARTTPCHLHFEIWPNGWHHGSPVDPEPALRRWDGWS